MSSDLSERYEVRRNNYDSGIRVRDAYIRVMVAYFDATYLPDAEARARQLCAELNAVGAKKVSEKP